MKPTYKVKEIFRTLQGEGANAGKAAVFVRFAGCNLWSGQEKDRATAVCRFCDTDFVGGAKLGLPDLIARIQDAGAGMVVLTGGEPLLQVNVALLDALHAVGRYVAVETNGTIRAPAGIDWICVSPKAGTEIKQRYGDELKVVGPQDGLDLSGFGRFTHHFVQPMAGNPDGLTWAIQVCLDNPGWRLSLQTHKIIGLP
jgi:7-carboxy-7-deazaguanine synthase